MKDIVRKYLLDIKRLNINPCILLAKTKTLSLDIIVTDSVQVRSTQKMTVLYAFNQQVGIMLNFEIKHYK